MRQAARCVRMAKLVTLQLHFLNQGQEQRVINLRPSDLLKTIIALPRCYQVWSRRQTSVITTFNSNLWILTCDVLICSHYALPQHFSVI